MSQADPKPATGCEGVAEIESEWAARKPERDPAEPPNCPTQAKTGVQSHDTL
jgi:hypothetical protein